MKNFEKWKSKNCEAKNCPHEASCNSCENIWRAALECMRDNNECNGEGYGCMLAAKIDEELEI